MQTVAMILSSICNTYTFLKQEKNYSSLIYDSLTYSKTYKHIYDIFMIYFMLKNISIFMILSHFALKNITISMIYVTFFPKKYIIIYSL